MQFALSNFLNAFESFNYLMQWRHVTAGQLSQQKKHELMHYDNINSAVNIKGINKLTVLHLTEHAKYQSPLLSSAEHCKNRAHHNSTVLWIAETDTCLLVSPDKDVPV